MSDKFQRKETGKNLGSWAWPVRRERGTSLGHYSARRCAFPVHGAGVWPADLCLLPTWVMGEAPPLFELHPSKSDKVSMTLLWRGRWF